MIISFSGHRPDKLGSYGAINPVRDKYKAKLRDWIEENCKYQQVPVTFISGMALGWDQWAVEVCIELGIPFEAAIPFSGQEVMWPKESQEKYRNLLTKASKVHILSKEYHPRKLQIRNEWMVDNADLVIAVWDGSPGGTKNCIDYANKIGKKVINLY